MQRRWVWTSSQKSIEDERVSVLAVLEIALSSLIFLAAYKYIGFSNFLMAAIFITPAFFLRSKESIAETQAYFERAKKRPHRFQLYGILLAYLLTTANAPVWAWVLTMFFAISLGIIFNVAYVQHFRALVFLREGLKSLPKNYYVSLFVTDLTAKPEMFPGSDKIGHLPHWNETIFCFRPRGFLQAFAIINVTAALLVSSLIRFLSKASCWIYLPLIFLTWPSKILEDKEYQAIWIKAQSAKAIELVRVVVAVLHIGFVAASLVSPEITQEYFYRNEDLPPPAFIISLYFIVDFSNIQPWQYCSIVNAVITIPLYFWMDSCRKEALAGKTDFGFNVSALLTLTRIRSILSLLWIAVIVVFTMRYYYISCSLPSNLDFLSAFFGDKACTPDS